jgi:DNA-binding response OmpR family regulator
MGLFSKTKIVDPVTDPSPVKKVLIIEDDSLFQNALSLKLKSAGYETLIADNGAIGLETIQAQKPDLVILDLMMPVMDGKTMLKKLRELPQFVSLPVFVLSNAGDADTIMQAKTYYNANEFLIKTNVTLDQIVTKIRQRIGS